ncbi:phytanoyl-CoA dioxygenase [Flavobacterium sp. WLB]|uniref:phytanoyl-CoA dioxygenase family protein n=1 Tax=unclassified Flavobacterium TaxID=196869 RepID=UPI0006ABEA55|nr:MULTISPECIES: phytanoyl-CoA dioxygenase family protein [unclassified Flavobacterium]KOP39751.1 phytanoyl-CoA dioxygenase [Flavobacterium sp. VMW]OWU92534.1 phytanoyl-CoA dioxygenase [Flavobacterium sp. NLM]PUU71029.1 phytanoyl-CoA dioxygenase [Flavobacterium sp. WLB]
MPWNILENLWNRTINTSTVITDKQWDLEIKTLFQLGISMEDTVQFLYFEKPDFETFKTWINNQKKNGNTVAATVNNVLSEQDLEFWDKNGYVIVKNAVSKKDCEDTVNAIWDYLEMDPDKSESWYKRHKDQKGLMLNFSDHETLNKNRFSPRIKKAYEQLYNSTKIYKTIDKVSFNPPETNEFTFLGSPLHWDISLKQPITFGFQGLLYLTDCGIDDGAFHCVPGFHNKINDWLNDLEPNENPRNKAIEILQPEPITGNAGDFIIWNNTLPHCASPNKGLSPRMVQYLTYLPDDYDASGEWI